MSAFFLVLFFLLHFSFPFYFHHLSPSLQLFSPFLGWVWWWRQPFICLSLCWWMLTSVRNTTSVWKILFLWGYRRCVSLWLCVDVCLYIRGATSGRPAAPWWQRRRVWHPAVLLLGDNGGCTAHFSYYRSLSLPHHHIPLTGLSAAHTDTYTCVASLPYLSERFHSPPYRLKPALTVLAPLTHTLSRGHTALWNNYSLNWQLINLKSIWPCQPNLEIKSYGSRDTEAKNWAGDGMEGAEKEAARDGGKW